MTKGITTIIHEAYTRHHDKINLEITHKKEKFRRRFRDLVDSFIVWYLLGILTAAVLLLATHWLYLELVKKGYL
jgi:hypothetical protein